MDVQAGRPAVKGLRRDVVLESQVPRGGAAADRQKGNGGAVHTRALADSLARGSSTGVPPHSWLQSSGAVCKIEAAPHWARALGATSCWLLLGGPHV